MARPKGSKNKKKVDDLPPQLKEKGNPLFNLNDAKPVDPSWADEDAPVGEAVASAAIMPEDLELDRQLEQMARNTEPVDAQDEPPPMKKVIDPYILLSEFEDDYKPAKTIHELDDQVFRAKQHEADSIEASEQLVRHFTKNCWAETQKVGYFTYKDIKVYIHGHFEKSVAQDRLTIEQKVFGNRQA